MVEYRIFLKQVGITIITIYFPKTHWNYDSTVLLNLDIALKSKTVSINIA